MYVCKGVFTIYFLVFFIGLDTTYLDDFFKFIFAKQGCFSLTLILNLKNIYSCTMIN